MSNVRLSGFVGADFLLTFAVKAAAVHDALVALCEGDWQGERIAPGSYELFTSMSPGALEEALMAHLHDGDLAVFYYLSDSKRIFRVALAG